MREFVCYWCVHIITGTSLVCGNCGKPVGTCR